MNRYERPATTLSRMLIGVAAIAAALVGCAPAANENAPLRSPSRDYAPAGPTTSDGETVGADGVSPGDRLQEGAVLGTGNAPSPAFKPETREPAPEPVRPSGPPNTDAPGKKP